MWKVLVLGNQKIDLDNVKPECLELRDEILRLKKRIKIIQPQYDKFKKRLILNSKERAEKKEIGHKLYDLNIKLISRLQELSICQEQ